MMEKIEWIEMKIKELETRLELMHNIITIMDKTQTEVIDTIKSVFNKEYEEVKKSGKL